MRKHLLALLTATLSIGAAGVQLLPAGQFSARDGRPGTGKHWSISDEQGTRIAAELTATAAKTKFLFDWDHQTLRAEANGQPAPAAGWATQFEWRPGEGLYATDVEWTARAQAAVDAKEYAYISPVITFDSAGNVTGVLMAAICNYPALLGMDALALSGLLNPDPQQEPTMNLLAALIALLGLPANATDAEALSAVQALKATPSAMPAALTAALGLQAGADEAAALAAVATLKGGDATTMATMQALQGQVAALQAQLTGNQVEALVADAIAAGKLLPAMKDWALAEGKKNLAVLQGYLAVAPKLPLSTPQTHGQQLDGDKAAVLDATGEAVLAQMGVSTEAWTKQFGTNAA